MRADSDTGTETITALATPPGRGGVGMVRVSGPRAGAIGATVLAGPLPAPRRAVLRTFYAADGTPLDEGLVLWMPGPDSFTGEDVLEFHGHGGPVVMALLIERVVALGARPARPGEFSERAFLNDRLDLAQAEAIADLIDSGSAEAARAAARSLRGEFSAAVHTLVAALTELRIFVEAAIDFPEEEIDFLADSELGTRLGDVLGRFDALQRSARQGALLREGMTVVIAGAPNAGKSSLLNRLAGYEAAIVTDVPGTTRDVLRERIDLHGMPLHIIDTAGLRASGDIVEREGMRRAEAEIGAADRVLLVVDARDPGPRPTLPAGVARTIVRNKIDLTDEPPGLSEENDEPVLRLSCTTTAGFDALRAHLEHTMGYRASESGVLMARRRHLDALARARAHVESGREQLLRSRAGELMAEELRLAQQALGEITGVVTSDDLLGQIFAGFCIGK